MRFFWLVGGAPKDDVEGLVGGEMRWDTVLSDREIQPHRVFHDARLMSHKSHILSDP